MTTQTIPAPALRGDDPLGFLASMGVVALAHVGAIEPVALGWSEGLIPHAEFKSKTYGDVAELGGALHEASAALQATGRVLPGSPEDIPRPTNGLEKDPNRMSPADAAALFADSGSGWLQNGDTWPSRWVAALYGQVVLDDQGRIRLTPLYAPFGRMSLRTSLYEKTHAAMTEIDGPADALTGWIRTDPSKKYDGANLDSKAKRDGAVTTHGAAANQGAPSPTWLAVMSPLLMPVAERAGRSGAIGWQQVRLRRDLTARSVVWPIWDGYLDGFALQTLLSHPALEVSRRDDGARLAHSSQLRGLGIRAVYGSSRSTQSQGDGPMAPARRLWPRNSKPQ